MTTGLFLLSRGAPFERTTVHRRRSAPRSAATVMGIVARRRRATTSAIILRQLTIKNLNNSARVMTRDDPTQAYQGWRSSHAPRDPIGLRLKTISFLNREIGKKIGEALGVNVTDMAALEQLLNNGPLTPSQLAERLKVTTAAATQIVDRLERAGHVSRERKTSDRRKIFVVPVEASVERAFEQLAPMLDGLDGVIAGLTPADRQVIEDFLDQVVEIYRGLAGVSPVPPDSHDPDPSSSFPCGPGVCR